MQTRPRRPVRRRLALLSTVGALVAIALLMLGIDALRHPLPSGGPVVAELVDEPGGDPRDPVECPEPAGDEATPRTGGDPVIGPPPPADSIITSNELYNCPETYDGRTVRYRGEVVGAMMDRGRRGTWTQLNDDVYAETLGPLPTHRDFRGGNSGVGALLPVGTSDLVDGVGGPARRGTVLEVVGTFHRVDPRSREVAVLVVRDVAVVRPSRPIDQPLLPERALVGTLLALLAIGLVITERVVSARR